MAKIRSLTLSATSDSIIHNWIELNESTLKNNFGVNLQIIEELEKSKVE